MNGDGSLGYWSIETSHYSYNHFNNDVISDNDSIEVSTGDVIRGHIFIDTRSSSYHKHVFYHSSDNVIGGSRSQENSHYSS